jgi:CRP-like cAMP-binding protein
MVSVNRLKEYSFFEGFSDEQLEKLAAIATEESCEAGNQIYKEGDPAEKFHLLEVGMIARVKENLAGSQDPPDEVTVDFVKKGEAMGWSAVIKPYVYVLGARCIDDSKLIAFNAAKLRELLNADQILIFKIEQAIWKTKLSRPDDERNIAFSFSPGCM